MFNEESGFTILIENPVLIPRDLPIKQMRSPAFTNAKETASSFYSL